MHGEDTEQPVAFDLHVTFNMEFTEHLGQATYSSALTKKKENRNIEKNNSNDI